MNYTFFFIYLICLANPDSVAAQPADAPGFKLSAQSVAIGLLAVAAGYALYRARRNRFKIKREQRNPSHYATKAYFADRHFAVVLNNISRNGANVQVGFLREQGQILKVFVEGRWLNAKVMWAAEDNFGLRFAQPLSNAQLRAIRSAGCATQTKTAPIQAPFR